MCDYICIYIMASALGIYAFLPSTLKWSTDRKLLITFCNHQQHSVGKYNSRINDVAWWLIHRRVHNIPYYLNWHVNCFTCNWKQILQCILNSSHDMTQALWRRTWLFTAARAADDDGTVRMVDEVVADAAQDRAPHSAHAARAHADHGRLLLVGDATDHLSRLPGRRPQHTFDLWATSTQRQHSAGGIGRFIVVWYNVRREMYISIVRSYLFLFKKSLHALLEVLDLVLLVLPHRG